MSFISLGTNVIPMRNKKTSCIMGDKQNQWRTKAMMALDDKQLTGKLTYKSSSHLLTTKFRKISGVLSVTGKPSTKMPS